MTKRGIPYEQVVAEVAQSLDPNADVKQGEPIEGPDGQLDRDVFVKGTLQGRSYSILVECKDHKNPIGRGYVDALESKRRDLVCDIAAICSNSGFTADAIHKARRVGIGLVAVMREGDQRIRFQVSDVTYVRNVRVEAITPTLEFTEPRYLSAEDDASLNYNGEPLFKWIVPKVFSLIAYNPIVSGTFEQQFNFNKPVLLSYHGGSVLVKYIRNRVTISGEWREVEQQLDSTSGVYDWLSRRIRQQLGDSQLKISGLGGKIGKRVNVPPRWFLDLMTKKPKPGAGMALFFAHVENIDMSEPAYGMDTELEDGELTFRIPVIPNEAMVSSTSPSASADNSVNPPPSPA